MTRTPNSATEGVLQNDELLCAILDNLNSAFDLRMPALVSRKWNRIITDYSWPKMQYLQLNCYFERKKLSIDPKLTNKPKHPWYLNVFARQFQPPGIPSAREVLLAILPRVPKLQEVKVSIERQKYIDEKWADMALQEFLNAISHVISCPRELAYTSSVAANGFLSRLISSNCRSLGHVRLNGTSWPSDKPRDLNVIPFDRCLTRALASCLQLKELILDDCWITGKATEQILHGKDKLEGLRLISVQEHDPDSSLPWLVGTPTTVWSECLLATQRSPIAYLAVDGFLTMDRNRNNSTISGMAANEHLKTISIRTVKPADTCWPLYFDVFPNLEKLYLMVFSMEELIQTACRVAVIIQQRKSEEVSNLGRETPISNGPIFALNLFYATRTNFQGTEPDKSMTADIEKMLERNNGWLLLNVSDEQPERCENLQRLLKVKLYKNEQIVMEATVWKHWKL